MYVAFTKLGTNSSLFDLKCFSFHKTFNSITIPVMQGYYLILKLIFYSAV